MREEGRAPITIFTFFLELRRALPVPTGLINVSYVPRDESWGGWTDADVADLLAKAEVRTDASGVAPHTAMLFRHIPETEPAPMSRVETAFADWGMKGLQPPSSPNRPGPEPPPGQATIEVMKTVIALTRFVPSSNHPIGRELTVWALHRIFFEGLTHLDALLGPLGWVADRWDVGALTLVEVPPEIPVLVSSTAPEAEGLPMVAFATEIHDGYPIAPDEFEDDDGFLREALELNDAANREEQPFLLVFRFLHAAEGERIAGDHTRALVDLNTAFELLVRLTLYHGQFMTGVPEAIALRANKASLRTKLTKYLPELLRREIDIDDPGNPWGAWYQGGYKLRNRAVHEGEVLDFDSVERAFAQSTAVFVDLQESLEAIEPLASLGQAIGMDYDNSGPEDGPLEIEFPWDPEESP
jgi:hypothetical protein